MTGKGHWIFGNCRLPRDLSRSCTPAAEYHDLSSLGIRLIHTVIAGELDCVTDVRFRNIHRAQDNPPFITLNTTAFAAMAIASVTKGSNLNPIDLHTCRSA
jgi:hypothetical protein